MKNFLITGDSLSYNRYGYDDTPRDNARDCHIGMPSWSFRLRNAFIASAKGFKYADEYNLENAVTGMGDGFHEYDAIFGDSVRTITPENGEIHLTAESDTGLIVLYIQTRPKNYCRFNISVDGVLVKEKLETYGDPGYYLSCGLITVELPCDKNKNTHEIVFSDFEYSETEPMVTLAGTSTAPVYANITGQGSRTSKFLLYHYNERIARYAPELMILIFGGNDFLLYSEDEYRAYLSEIFERVTADFPGIKLLTITIPPSGIAKEEVRGVKYTSDAQLNDALDKYNSVMEELSLKHNAICIKTKDVFAGVDAEKWRYDNVHMTRLGNDMLLEAVIKKLTENSIEL